MQFTPLSIPDIIYIKPDIFYDQRGYFFESYHQKKYQEAGITDTFIQDNQSKSTQGTLRGLHYQLPPMAQSKLVRVLEGTIFDIAVDVRKNSSTLGQWVGQELSADRMDSLYIPIGYAHGFYVLSETAVVYYKCNELYAKSYERAIRWDDPEINIQWPILASTPLISEKDRVAPLLSQQTDLF